MFKRSPDSLLIITVILLLFTGLTWVIPAGSYERAKVEGRTVVVPGTYSSAEANPQGPGDFLMAPLKGIVGASHIIGFVLLVGGAFSMLTATGSLDAGLQQVIRFAGRHPAARGLIIPILMALFSLAGCTFGMSEEVLVFVLITLPLSASMGYDRIVGVAIPFIGAGVGFAGAALNPFTVGIAQGIAEIPLFSGAGVRWLVWAVLTLAAILFVTRYAHRLARSKTVSPLSGEDPADAPEYTTQAGELPFNFRRKAIVVLFLASLGVLMYGAMELGWYIQEICAVFIALGILSAIIGHLNIEESLQSFKKGVGEMLPAALIIGLSKGILVVAEDGQIIDTVLFHVSGVMDGMPDSVAAQAMFFVQGFINFFIPSGSGQAAITMPIMTPLADILEISRQTAVLAYQFGDGLFNLIIPTSGVTMGVLSIARIPFGTWLRWIAPLMLILVVLAMLFLGAAEYLAVW